MENIPFLDQPLTAKFHRYGEQHVKLGFEQGGTNARRIAGFGI
jgi:hypothetical protein